MYNLVLDKNIKPASIKVVTDVPQPLVSKLTSVQYDKLFAMQLLFFILGFLFSVTALSPIPDYTQLGLDKEDPDEEIITVRTPRPSDDSYESKENPYGIFAQLNTDITEENVPLTTILFRVALEALKPKQDQFVLDTVKEYAEWPKADPSIEGDTRSDAEKLVDFAIGGLLWPADKEYLGFLEKFADSHKKFINNNKSSS